MNRKKMMIVLASLFLVGSNISICKAKSINNKSIKEIKKYNDDKYDDDKYDDKYDEDDYDTNTDDNGIYLNLPKKSSEKHQDTNNSKKYRNDKVETDDVVYLENKFLYRYIDKKDFNKLNNKQKALLINTIKSIQGLNITTETDQQLTDYEKNVYMNAVNAYEYLFNKKLAVDKIKGNNKKSNKLIDKNRNDKKIKLNKTKYQKIKNLDNFDMTPIAYNNQGYIVKVKNKYGFINSNGDYIVKPQYSGIFINAQKDSDEKGLYFVEDAETKVDNKGVYLKSNDDVVSKTNISNGGYGGVNQISLKYDDQKVYVCEGNSRILLSKYKKYAKENDSVVPNKSMKLASEYDDGEDKAFITPNNEIIELDDDNDENTFIIEKSEYNGKTSEVILTDNSAKGLVAGELNDKPIIVDETGVYFANVDFDYAKYASINGMQITNGRNKGVIIYNSKNKNNVYNGYELAIYGLFDDVAQPINDKSIVKKDGQWQLVKLK